MSIEKEMIYKDNNSDLEVKVLEVKKNYVNNTWVTLISFKDKNSKLDDFNVRILADFENSFSKL